MAANSKRTKIQVFSGFDLAKEVGKEKPKKENPNTKKLRKLKNAK